MEKRSCNLATRAASKTTSSIVSVFKAPNEINRAIGEIENQSCGQAIRTTGTTTSSIVPVFKTTSKINIVLGEIKPVNHINKHLRTNGNKVEQHHNPSNLYQKPLNYWDVYMDNFCGLAQGNNWKQWQTKGILLHLLDKVFWPVDKQDTQYRQKLALRKKMLKGDATWATTKDVLSWTIDTVKGTPELPARQKRRLLELLQSINPRQRWIDVKQWEKSSGEL